MKTINIVLLGILGLIVIFILGMGMWFWSSYNGLVNSSSQVDLTFSAIQTQYQRRFDLIPNLAEATKGFLNQEKTIMKDIADARTHYSGSAQGSSAQIGAMGQFDGALSRLMVVMENYPNLKSDATVKNLMDELSGTENRVTVARDRYNESARSYNVVVKSFPKNLIAGMFGFHTRDLFQAEEGASKGVKINLTE